MQRGCSCTIGYQLWLYVPPVGGGVLCNCFGCGCSAGTLKLLPYYRPRSPAFCNPILDQKTKTLAIFENSIIMAVQHRLRGREWQFCLCEVLGVKLLLTRFLSFSGLNFSYTGQFLCKLNLISRENSRISILYPKQLMISIATRGTFPGYLSFFFLRLFLELF